MADRCRHPKKWWRLSADRRFVICDACWSRVPRTAVLQGNALDAAEEVFGAARRVPQMDFFGGGRGSQIAARLTDLADAIERLDRLYPPAKEATA